MCQTCNLQLLSSYWCGLFKFLKSYILTNFQPIESIKENAEIKKKLKLVLLKERTTENANLMILRSIIILCFRLEAFKLFGQIK